MKIDTNIKYILFQHISAKTPDVCLPDDCDFVLWTVENCGREIKINASGNFYEKPSCHGNSDTDL